MKSIKLRLTLMFSILILSITIVLGGVTTSILRNNLIKDAHQDLENISRLEAKYIESVVKGELMYLEGLAQNSIILDEEIPLENKVDFLRGEAERMAYDRFTFVNLNGDTLHLDGSGPGGNVSHRKYFQNASQGITNVSDIIISQEDDEMILIYATPVRDAYGNIQGVLYGRKGATVLSEPIDDFEYRNTGYAYILNNHGTLVAHPNDSLVMNQYNFIEEGKKDKNLEELADIVKNQMMTRISGSAIYYFNGKNRVVGFFPIENSEWIMAVAINEEEILEEIYSIRRIFILITLFFIMIGIISTYFISNSISKPIIDITEILKLQAKLDFSSKENAEAVKLFKRKDEIGTIVRALNEMEDSVRNFIVETSNKVKFIENSSSNLDDITDQSAIGAEEIAKTIEKMAIGVNQQASDTESATSSVEKINNLLEENNSYIQNLNSAADIIDSQKVEGFDIVKELIKASVENDRITSEVYSFVASNSKNADEIADASKMIENIAEQTNLLALNAAIEAARAGEAGKGFSVVADEIRKLAEQSNLFAGKIKEVIDRLKSESSGAVGKMEEAHSIVEVQNKKVEETKEKFESIAEAIESVKEVTKMLNKSSENMSVNKDTIIELMQSLFAIAQENAAGSEEASAAMEQQAASIIEIANSSKDLSKVAEELEAMIAKFKV